MEISHLIMATFGETFIPKAALDSDHISLFLKKLQRIALSKTIFIRREEENGVFLFF